LEEPVALSDDPLTIAKNRLQLVGWKQAFAAPVTASATARL
jgi:hypothetical protein